METVSILKNSTEILLEKRALKFLDEENFHSEEIAKALKTVDVSRSVSVSSYQFSLAVLRSAIEDAENDTQEVL